MPTIDIVSNNDTLIFEQLPDDNFGNELALQTGREETLYLTRALLAFDLSSIPEGSTINSVSLTLRMFFQDSTNRDHSVYGLRVPFVELQATWNSRSTGNAWGTAGASNTSTDIYPTPVGTFITPNNANSQDIVITINNDLSLIENGVLVKADDESTGFSKVQYYSRNYATNPAFRPFLTIDYTENSGLDIELSGYQNEIDYGDFGLNLTPILKLSSYENITFFGNPNITPELDIELSGFEQIVNGGDFGLNLTPILGLSGYGEAILYGNLEINLPLSLTLSGYKQDVSTGDYSLNLPVSISTTSYELPIGYGNFSITAIYSINLEGYSLPIQYGNYSLNLPLNLSFSGYLENVRGGNFSIGDGFNWYTPNIFVIPKTDKILLLDKEYRIYVLNPENRILDE